MWKLLSDLPEVETPIDDILLSGASQKEHDKQLTAALTVGVKKSMGK